MNARYLKSIKDVMETSNIPSMIFLSDLHVVTANTKEAGLLSTWRLVYPVVRATYFSGKRVDKKVAFEGKISNLIICPVYEKGVVTGAFVTAREN
jgi:hypothetical protein